jgi:hypothetical protein
LAVLVLVELFHGHQDPDQEEIIIIDDIVDIGADIIGRGIDAGGIGIGGGDILTEDGTMLQFIGVVVLFWVSLPCS